ncbi:protein of unknown function [Paenibacillus sp. UNC496MF]|uniref:DUF4362 domain-containing protein n=1 Tax=Paenibacillus sp. UNC496MF TaxID=1502753 RepID=UPI0008E1681C|nr:DUF4362 domain-containing protein [Paenibacillus sp. UNC496MF]SFI49713.1 protein of unknown function [Paenibacillus sp. UNC496MF]
MTKTMAAVLLAAALLEGCGRSDGSGAGGSAAGFPKPAKPYASEEAAKNGDVVNVHGRYTNLDKWLAFAERVESGKDEPAQVRVTAYTIEGDPIISELVYDGQTIHFTYDNAMDAFGKDLGRPAATCAGIARQAGKDGIVLYALKGCDGEAGGFFRLAVPEKELGPG